VKMRAVEGEVSFPAIEEKILQFWQNNKIFAAQNALRSTAKEFAFYDGPPFANGLPHYGHLLANTIKDTVPRYWIMRGYKVERRFGWDCHGLPVEFEIEKRENLRGRPDILALGYEKFNEMCRDSVLHYAGEWQKVITRLGRWVDWENQYRTMDLPYMETVWWIFAELYRRGLIYQGFKVVPYSPRTASVVSNFEANQNYQDVQDPSIFIKFKLREQNTWILSWTTTPWTLPANLALAVSPDITYVKIRDTASGEEWILAEARLAPFYATLKPAKGDKNAAAAYEVLATMQGTDLVGLRYEPLFPYCQDHENAFVVLAANYVTTTDGTGVVHQAPAFGEDDYLTCLAHNIALFDPIDDSGCFTPMVPDLSGTYFKDADREICRKLKQQGNLLHQGTLVHSYPFDERTNTPLIYKAVPSWYVAVEKVQEALVANNQKINWVPSHLKDGRMGNWLANARDWSISRNRFWGTPLPVWVCAQDAEHVTVIGSVQELAQKTGTAITDIHLHHVKPLSFACAQCQGSMHNIGLVFDCWFESGAMPYAQLHYPFANKERFAHIFPADFVAEGLDQTRGWFYTLNVLSTALFNKPAFKNVVVNGVINDAEGKKMSKRHRNYTPPEALMDKFGADSVRLYMLNSPLLRAENLIFTDLGVHTVTRALLLPLWNAYSFLATYAIADNWHASATLLSATPPASAHKLDKWIISRLQSTIAEVHQHMESYRLYQVIPPIVTFIDDLTNWYIRNSRRRFWGDASSQGISAEQEAAFSTLTYVLQRFSMLAAPFIPFLAEELYQSLRDGNAAMPLSVHLCELPESREALRDVELEAQMALIRNVINLGRSLRQKHGIKTRQVLPSMLVITHKQSDQQTIERYYDLIAQELNVKQVQFSSDEARHVRLSLQANLPSLGKRLGKELGQMRAHLQQLSNNPQEVGNLLARLDEEGSVEVLGHRLTSEDFLISRSQRDERLIASERGVTILLDTSLSEELKAEGFARELVNRIQNLRKDSSLVVSDRIHLQVIVPAAMLTALAPHQAYIQGETLATEMKIAAGGGDCLYKFTQSYLIDEMACIIALEKEDK
jgi:isoleucyl-tRNA synthetase